jgi:putative copper resistance protein D
MLITLHLLGLSFWVGVFTPLYRLAARDTGRTIGPVSQEFGRKAIWVVGALTLAGGMTLWLLTGNLLTAVFTPYGQIFAIKLLAFLAIIGFAAWNNLSLTPALLRQEPKAAIHLRHSVSMEIAIVAMILLTTAVLTTISAPVSSV